MNSELHEQSIFHPASSNPSGRHSANCAPSIPDEHPLREMSNRDGDDEYFRPGGTRRFDLGGACANLGGVVIRVIETSEQDVSGNSIANGGRRAWQLRESGYKNSGRRHIVN